MLPDAELNAMRTELETLMPDTVVIQTVARASDGQGGWVDSWAASGTVSGRIDPAPFQFSGEEKAGGAVQPHHAYFVTIPYDTTITTNNRVVVNSETYEITSVDKGKSWAITKRVIVERV